MIVEHEINRLHKIAFDLSEEVDELHHLFREKTVGLPGITEEEAMQLVRSCLPEQNMSQKALAQFIGVSPSTMSMALRGKRKLSFSAVLHCLQIVGYKLVAVHCELPFTPEGE